MTVVSQVSPCSSVMESLVPKNTTAHDSHMTSLPPPIASSYKPDQTPSFRPR